MEKRKIGYVIPIEVLDPFMNKCEDMGLMPGKFIEFCMKSYVDAKIEVMGNTIVSTELLARGSDTQQGPTLADKKGPGRPAKIKEEPKIALEGDPKTAFDKQLPPEARLLKSYRYILTDERFDPTPTLTFDMEGKTGTLEDMFRDEWLEFRSGEAKLISEDDWLFAALEYYCNCIFCKFAEVNGIKGRFRKEPVWTQVIDLNAELTVLYEKTLDERGVAK